MTDDDITLRRIAQRYADEPDYKRTVDMALGVFHVPKHPEGECEACDAQREREAAAGGTPGGTVSDRELAPYEQPDWDGEHCRDCGRGYQLVWSAEHDLWNAIWGNEGGLLCPDCFDLRCRAQGIYLRFRAVPL